MTEREKYKKGIAEISARLKKERAERERKRQERLETYENWWGHESGLAESTLRKIKESYAEFESHKDWD